MRSLPVDHPPTVRVEDLSGHVRRIVRSEENKAGGAFFRLARAAQRGIRTSLAPDFGRGRTCFRVPAATSVVGAGAVFLLGHGQNNSILGLFSDVSSVSRPLRRKKSSFFRKKIAFRG